MEFFVKVIPNSKEIKIINGNPLIVKLKSPPENNKANKELIEVLSQHFKVPKTKIKIVKGIKSRIKLIKIT
jgi:uncharacterized protein (TIGR00251 family)